MDICEFVNQNFGADERKKMLNIRRGGDNNEKGGKFEQYFSVSFIINTIAATPPSKISKITITSQEMGFVDDVIVRDYNLSKKINYQAKNSAGSQADWTDEIKKRFEMQQYIDVNFHGFPNATQVLLVSSEQKHIENNTKIKKLSVSAYRSEFFPSAPSTNQLLEMSAQTRNALEQICGKKSLSTLDHGFKVMLGVWCGSNGQRAISDIFQAAKEMSKPDIFEKAIPPQPPQWLIDKINSLNNISYTVESTNFSVQYNGLEVDIYRELPEPSESKLSEITNEIDFVIFLFSLTKDDYKHD